ncbi:MAG: rhodanese-like domain-containing protein [Myxococcaceae bacterium]|nr:rhodanese-like domain-containing protein [Myxococcaceae bacterium]
MKRIVMSAVLAASFIVPTAAFACEGMQQASVEPKKVTVADVATWSKAKSKFTPVDANGKSTRESQGVIPGAVLLTSSSGYDVKELPADKANKLVFYCANESCGASKQAAKKALEAGYTDVAVLPEGIAGWKKAGQPTSKPNS